MKRSIILFLSTIAAVAGLAMASAPTTRVSAFRADPREDRVFLSWQNPNVSIQGCNVYRKTGARPWQRLNGTPVKAASFRDSSVATGQSWRYRVVPVLASGDEGTPSPAITVEVNKLTDDRFLDMVARATFNFFWEKAAPETFLILDNSKFDNVYSIASTGFGLSAMVVAAERGYRDRAAIEHRVLTILQTLNKSTAKNGILYHYLNADGTPTTSGYETVASTVDTALLLMGAITAGEYFGGEIKVEADKLFAHANFKAFADMKRRLVKMAWEPLNKDYRHSKGHFHQAQWDYYSDEAIICTVLGISAPNAGCRLPPDFFYRWTRFSARYVPTTKGYTPTAKFVYSWSGALFTYQFSHLWIDFKKLGKDNPSSTGVNVPAVNWFDNSVAASEAAWLYCVDRRKQFKSFGPRSWGLTACAAEKGYYVGGFFPRGDQAKPHLDGTIAPYGAGSSIIFTPEKSIAALRYYYNLKDRKGRRIVWSDEYEGGCGFHDSFNLDTGFVAKEYIGIDQGPLLLAIENYRSGLVKNNFMKNKHIRRGLERIGFKPQQSSNHQNKR